MHWYFLTQYRIPAFWTTNKTHSTDHLYITHNCLTIEIINYIEILYFLLPILSLLSLINSFRLNASHIINKADYILSLPKNLYILNTYLMIFFFKFAYNSKPNKQTKGNQNFKCLSNLRLCKRKRIEHDYVSKLNW